MSGKNMVPRAVVVIPLLAAVACSELASPGSPSGDGPAIEQEVVRLEPGGRQALTLAHGTHVVWLSGDTAVATVDSDGVVTATSPGTTWAFATSPAARDSVRVVVSFEDAIDGVAFSLDHTAASLQLKGVSRLFRSLHQDYDFTEITGSVNPEEPGDASIVDFFWSEDTVVVLKLDDEPVAGLHEVTPWEIVAGPDSAVYIYGREGAFVYMRLPGSEDLAAMYVPVTPMQLEIDVSDIPAAIGPATGRLVGRVSFDAAGLLIRLGPNGRKIVGQVSPDIVPFFAEFDLAQRIRPIGGGRLVVSGGPIQVTNSMGGVNVGVWKGGLTLRTGYGGSGPSGALARHHLWVGSPAVGTFEIGPLPLHEFLVSDSVLFAPDRVVTFTETGMISDVRGGEGLPNIGIGESGTLTITRFEAPGPETWGMFEATLETGQYLGFGGSPGDRQTVTMEVTAPIMPANDSLAPARPGASGGVPGVRIVGNGNGQIVGRFAADNQPVLGIEVTLAWSGGTASVLPNEVGHFRFMGLAPGDYEISFDVPSGYALAEGQSRTIGPLTVTPDQHPSAPVWVPIDLVRTPTP